MQANLLDITIGVEFMLFMGYLLYGIMRTYPAKEDRFTILFYTTILIGFVTSIFILNSILSLPRYLPGDIPILILLLAVDIVFFFIIIVDTFRQKQSKNETNENKET
jgi:hypothetical protein